MTMQVEELPGRFESNEIPRVQATYGYYRQPDGWITASPATDNDELKYRREGWEPLKRYGLFEMVTAYSVSHPLEVLLLRGGAHELSVDQIRRQGLYMDPPKLPACHMALSQDHKRHTYEQCYRDAKPVVFPQLSGVTGLGPFPCRLGCGRELPTEEARGQHETVMHAPEKSDQRTGESLSEALIKGLGSQQDQGDSMAAVLERIETLQRELEALKHPALAPGGNGLARTYVATCAECGHEARSVVEQKYADAGLRSHRRAKHPKAAAVTA